MGCTDTEDKLSSVQNPDLSTVVAHASPAVFVTSVVPAHSEPFLVVVFSRQVTCGMNSTSVHAFLLMPVNRELVCCQLYVSDS